jgi:hypothetical protein
MKAHQKRNYIFGLLYVFCLQNYGNKRVIEKNLVLMGLHNFLVKTRIRITSPFQNDRPVHLNS